MRILITAGPTREYLDPVRFLSNPSSGKMGYAIARAAARRGHEVILISGPVSLPEPKTVEVIHVTNAHEMFQASVREFRKCQAAIMTAAVCDYRPIRRAARKRKKETRRFSLPLEPTKDICSYLGHRKGERLVIGFAMEDHRPHAHAEEKLRRKRCDAIVLNGLSNVGADNAEIEILKAGGTWSKPLRSTKTGVARAIVRLIEDLAGITERGHLPASRKNR